MFAWVPPCVNSLPHSSYSSYRENNSASLLTSAKNKKELLFFSMFLPGVFLLGLLRLHVEEDEGLRLRLGGDYLSDRAHLRVYSWVFLYSPAVWNVRGRMSFMGRRIEEILNFCGCSAYTILTKEDHKIEIFCRHPKCIAPTRRTI